MGTEEGELVYSVGRKDRLIVRLRADVRDTHGGIMKHSKIRITALALALFTVLSSFALFSCATDPGSKPVDPAGSGTGAAPDTTADPNVCPIPEQDYGDYDFNYDIHTAEEAARLEEIAAKHGLRLRRAPLHERPRFHSSHQRPVRLCFALSMVRPLRAPPLKKLRQDFALLPLLPVRAALPTSWFCRLWLLRSFDRRPRPLFCPCCQCRLPGNGKPRAPAALRADR